MKTFKQPDDTQNHEDEKKVWIVMSYLLLGILKKISRTITIAGDFQNVFSSK